MTGNINKSKQVIENIRFASGKKLGDLVDTLGISRSSFYKKLTGNMLTMADIELLCMSHNIDFDDICGCVNPQHETDIEAKLEEILKEIKKG